MKKVILGLVLAAGLAGAASAAPVYPVAVVETNTNGTILSPERADPLAMFDGDTTTFYSLGLGGYAILDFGPGGVKSPGSVTEVTFRLAGYIEKLRVLISNSLDPASFVSVATVENDEAQAPSGAVLSFVAPAFRYVKLLDFSPVRADRDGFDVAEISFSPVPLPAAGFLLGGALFGLGALRRRRAKKA
ncbi:MAG: VPLPA-CTERM sorting domain-containing protein [Paracoccaceae bacterium]